MLGKDRLLFFGGVGGRLHFQAVHRSTLEHRHFGAVVLPGLWVGSQALHRFVCLLPELFGFITLNQVVDDFTHWPPLSLG